MMFIFFFEYEQPELWLDIKNYEGLYQISNFGRVRSVEHTIIMSNGAKRLIKSKILVLHEGGNNKYLQAYLHKDCVTKNHLVHRLVVSHFIGMIPNGMEVNHKNGIVQDNRVVNLEIVTHQENIDHSMSNNLFKAYGENHYAAKLTNAQAAKIRELYKSGKANQYQLAKEYHVRQNTISRIVNFISRKHESSIN